MYSLLRTFGLTVPSTRNALLKDSHMAHLPTSFTGPLKCHLLKTAFSDQPIKIVPQLRLLFPFDLLSVFPPVEYKLQGRQAFVLFIAVSPESRTGGTQ